MLNSDCWTQTNDVHGLGGIPHNFTTLAECQAECINDDTCVAIDWEPSNAEKSCWLLTLSYTVPTIIPDVITHYALYHDCPSKFYYYYYYYYYYWTQNTLLYLLLSKYL